jgi:amyloid beta precursor protein binding protein 1
VKQFYEKHQCLPLPGKLPDMKAQSKVYIQLQGIYKAKARKDAAEILQIVQAAPGGEHVDPAEVDLFCKNAAFVKLINATGGGGSSSDAKISRADRLKSAAGKQTASPLEVTPPWMWSAFPGVPSLPKAREVRSEAERDRTERNTS